MVFLHKEIVLWNCSPRYDFFFANLVYPIGRVIVYLSLKKTTKKTNKTNVIRCIIHVTECR